MNLREFDIVLEETIVSIKRLLTVKGGEYAGNEDRLANFKRGAERVGLHPLQVLWIYTSKHVDSVETYIKDVAQGKTRERSEPIEGRLDDIINYCILAKALVAETVAKPALVPHRDSHFNGGGVWDIAADTVSRVPPAGYHPAFKDQPGHNGDLHSGVNSAGVSTAKVVQPDSPVVGQVKETKL